MADADDINSVLAPYGEQDPTTASILSHYYGSMIDQRGLPGTVSPSRLRQLAMLPIDMATGAYRGLSGLMQHAREYDPGTKNLENDRLIGDTTNVALATPVGAAIPRAVESGSMNFGDWLRAKLAPHGSNLPDPAILERMRINPLDPRWETDPGVSFAHQPIDYPRYDYQVFDDKGRWMNDPLPSMRTEGNPADLDGLRKASNNLAKGSGEELPYHTTDPFANHDFALSETWRSKMGLPNPETGYGAQPGLPQYPRIPAQWVPENNPAKLTLYGPPGIVDRPTFTGESLQEILRQIARTELKPSDRAYLEAMARQKFGKNTSPK